MRIKNCKNVQWKKSKTLETKKLIYHHSVVNVLIGDKGSQNYFK